MPVTIKTSAMKYKNPDTGQYEGVDMIEEKAVRDIVADDYSPTSPYAVDAYCLYNGDYYRCTTAIQSGEAWNASHWTPTQVSDELVSIKGAVDSIGTNEVANESNVSGATATAALNTLNGAINAIAGDLAPVLTQLKADTNLIAGDLRVYNNQLYRVTQNVSSGASLIVGTNIAAVNLSNINQTYSGTANSFTKMADGTLIQWGERTIALQQTMQQVGSLNLYYGLYTLNFDLPFKDYHYAIYVQSQYGTGFLFPATGNPQANQDGTSTSAAIWFYDVYQRAASETPSLKIRWCAIGRWK